MKIKGFVITGSLFCIAGATLMIVGAAQTNFNFDFNFDNVVVEDVSYEESFSKITYNAKYDNLEIKYGDVDNIMIKSKHSEHMSYNFVEEDGNLYITQAIEASSWWDGFKWLNSCNVPFEIILPQNEEISFEIDLSAGNINVDKIKADGFKVKANAGNVNFDNATLVNTNLEVDAGNLEIDNSMVYNLVADVNAGSISFDGSILTNADFSVDCGNLDLVLNQNRELFNINGKGNGTIGITYVCNLGGTSIEYR